MDKFCTKAGMDGSLPIQEFSKSAAILRNSDLQNTALGVAETLLAKQPREGREMPEAMSRKAKLFHSMQAQENPAAGADVDSSNAPRRPIIELDDRTAGPEAEINRLKAKMITVREEIGQLRNENDKLATDHEKLKLEFRELKLVLAKLEVKELRAVERVNSWMSSIRILQEMIGKGDNNQEKRSL